MTDLLTRTARLCDQLITLHTASYELGRAHTLRLTSLAANQMAAARRIMDIGAKLRGDILAQQAQSESDSRLVKISTLGKGTP